MSCYHSHGDRRGVEWCKVITVMTDAFSVSLDIICLLLAPFSFTQSYFKAKLLLNLPRMLWVFENAVF